MKKRLLLLLLPCSLKYCFLALDPDAEIGRERQGKKNSQLIIRAVKAASQAMGPFEWRDFASGFGLKYIAKWPWI